MGNCEKCWDAPCICGWEYRNWSDEEFKRFIQGISEGRAKYRLQLKEGE